MPVSLRRVPLQNRYASKSWCLQAAPDILTNEWVTKGDELRLPRILVRQYMGDGCFDHNYYRRHNGVRQLIL